MKKWFIGVLVIFLVVGVSMVLVLFNLGVVVKTAVNHYGPDITKTEMRLGTADVSVFDGTARLENFVLGNPEGFSSPNAITIGSLQVDVDETTLTRDVIVIDRIMIADPAFTLEFVGKTDNFRAIMDNLKKTKRTADQEQPAAKGGKKIVIRDLVLKNIQVKTVAAIAGGDISATTISEIHLTNIGEKQNGVEVAQAVLIVLNELYGQIIASDLPGALKSRLKGLESEVGGATKELKSIGNQLKGLMGN